MNQSDRKMLIRAAAQWSNIDPQHRYANAMAIGTAGALCQPAERSGLSAGDDGYAFRYGIGPAVALSDSTTLVDHAMRAGA